MCTNKEALSASTCTYCVSHKQTSKLIDKFSVQFEIIVLADSCLKENILVFLCLLIKVSRFIRDAITRSPYMRLFCRILKIHVIIVIVFCESALEAKVQYNSGGIYNCISSVFMLGIYSLYSSFNYNLIICFVSGSV